MNIIIKPRHNTPQKVTLVKHYNILLDHMAIWPLTWTTNWFIFWGILQKYDPENPWNIRLIWCGPTVLQTVKMKWKTHSNPEKHIMASLIGDSRL